MVNTKSPVDDLFEGWWVGEVAEIAATTILKCTPVNA